LSRPRLWLQAAISPLRNARSWPPSPTVSLDSLSSSRPRLWLPAAISPLPNALSPPPSSTAYGQIYLSEKSPPYFSRLYSINQDSNEN
jgi:hypothetical protein